MTSRQRDARGQAGCLLHTEEPGDADDADPDNTDRADEHDYRHDAHRDDPSGLTKWPRPGLGRRGSASEAQPPDSGAPNHTDPSDDPTADGRGDLKLAGLFIAAITLISALAFYFGWAVTSAKGPPTSASTPARSSSRRRHPAQHRRSLRALGAVIVLALDGLPARRGPTLGRADQDDNWRERLVVHAAGGPRARPRYGRRWACRGSACASCACSSGSAPSGRSRCPPPSGG
jgi:hypothetical protein